VTLTDPREALADQSDFIGYLVGLAGLAQVVHSLAADSRCRDGRSDGTHHADDFVHALVGLASIGAAIDRLANSTNTQHNPTDYASPLPSAVDPTAGWLR
jgi:hypothetical protein